MSPGDDERRPSLGSGASSSSSSSQSSASPRQDSGARRRREAAQRLPDLHHPRNHHAPALDDQDAASPAQLTAAYLRSRIAVAGDNVPELGSPEWLRLPRNHPASVAAICRAALAWHREGQPEVTAARLRMELEEEPRGRRVHLDELWHDACADVDGLARHTEKRRKAIQEAQPSRPDDYPGGPLTKWDRTDDRAAA